MDWLESLLSLGIILINQCYNHADKCSVYRVAQSASASQEQRRFSATAGVSYLLGRES